MTGGSDDRGLAVILALLVTSLLCALGVTLLLVSDTERRLSSNDRTDQETRYAAGAGLDLALADLETTPDWSAVLAGGQPSTFQDATRRPVLPSGRLIDLDALTTELQASSFGGAAFGANTPMWRLFSWGPLAALDPAVRFPNSQYLAVWVADDLSDEDGAPLADSNDVLTVHAEAFGLGAGRRAIEATIERVGGRLRTIAWREL